MTSRVRLAKSLFEMKRQETACAQIAKKENTTMHKICHQIQSNDETFSDSIEIEITDSEGKITKTFLFWDDGWIPRDGEENGIVYRDGFAFARRCDFCSRENAPHLCWRCDCSYCDNCYPDCERLDECGEALLVCPECDEAAD